MCWCDGVSVRERDASSYAICLSHESTTKHYRIDIFPSGNFAIQDGPEFDNIMAVRWYSLGQYHIIRLHSSLCLAIQLIQLQIQLKFNAKQSFDKKVLL